MKSIRQSLTLIAMLVPMLASFSVSASSHLFLCGDDALVDTPEVPVKRRTEHKLAFFLDDDELPELDRVVESYQTMTFGHPKALAPHRLHFGDDVMKAELWQGPWVNFLNTHEILFENKSLMESLLFETPAYNDLVRKFPGRTLYLRRVLRTVR